MRIAFFLNQFPLLSETFILNQITGLIDRGHDVEIIAWHRGDTQAMHADVVRYQLLERAHYIEFPSGRVSRVAQSLTRCLPRYLRKPSALVGTLNFARHGLEALSLQLQFAGLPFLRRPPFDVVHCHFGPNGRVASMLRRAGAIDGKITTTFLGYDLSRWLLQRGNDIYREMWRQGDRFLPICRAFRDQIVDLGCPQEKTTIHHLGIDRSRFRFRERQPSPEVRLVSIARLVDKKGIEYGLRAIARIADDHPGVRYQIVGDGPLRAQLEALTRELGLGERVQFLGGLPQEEVIAVLEGAHIFLAPSVTATDGDREGTPTVILEALAMGIPVLSTVHSGIPEQVEDGRSGYLVPERDVDALADKLGALLSQPEQWPAMGRAGRDHIAAEFDIEKLNDRLERLLKEL